MWVSFFIPFMYIRVERYLMEEIKIDFVIAYVDNQDQVITY